MAATVVISCPQCKKQMKVPPDFKGKKVRCQGCSHVFTVGGPTGIQAKPTGGAPPKKPASPAKPAKTPGPAADEDDDGKPYQLTGMAEVARCPHCTEEMESEDAVVCLHCGFNTQTRTHLETKKTIAPTGFEQFLWLLPGILCIPAMILMIVHALMLIIGRVNGNAPLVFSATYQFLFGDPDKEDKILPRAIDCCVIWWLIGYGFGIYKCIQFGIKRLIQQPKKPEKVMEE